MKKKIYAVDFDGVIVKNDYPRIGKLNEEVVEKMRRLKEEGHDIILWTCRVDKKLEEAVEFCKKNNVPFDCVNDNTEDSKKAYNNDCRKVWANYYIDDQMLSIEEFVLGTIEERNKYKSELEMKSLEFANLVVKYSATQDQEEKQKLSEEIDEMLKEIEVLKKKAGM